MSVAAEISAKIIDLERKCDALENLCGNIVATMSVTVNRDRLLAGDKAAIESLLAIADAWERQFVKISGPFSTPIPKAKL